MLSNTKVRVSGEQVFYFREMQDLVNKGEDDEMEICGYSRSGWRTLLTWLTIVLTLGFLRLVFYWKPNWYLKWTHTETDLVEASHVLLKDKYNQEFVEKLKSFSCERNNEQLFSKATKTRSSDPTPLSMQHKGEKEGYELSPSPTIPEMENQQLEGMRYFVNKKVKYLFCRESGGFVKLRGIEAGKLNSYFYEAGPLTNTEAARRRVLYGANILEVHVTRVIVLVLRLASNPFYVFQIFSCSLWYADEYYYYASAILVISIGSLAVTTYITRKMERALKRTVHQFGSASVRREGATHTVLPTELVPGDIIELPRSGCVMDVDAVLLCGTCIVNESMLTGESIPVTKTPLPNPANSDMVYDAKHHSKHTLYCGTQVIQTRYYSDQPVTAMVIKTGFMTAKGGLLRSIMFPKPVDFKFYRDTYMFILVLACMSFLGMIYTLVLMIRSQYDAGLIARRVLDLVTIAVPPALPAALAVGTLVSQYRLKRRASIYCIIPNYINIAGSINVVCFDKTGTLTEEGLDLQGLLPVDGDRFGEFTQDTRNMLDNSDTKAAMACCHSLTYIDGELSGDPLDVKMFEATGWQLEELGEESNRYDMIMPTVVRSTAKTEDATPEIGILRQFTFSSALQRMSVVVKNLSRPSFDLYAKGSPEMISSLCRAETLPSDFSDRLAEYTSKGYRVIALAHRQLSHTYAKLQKVDRSDVEVEMDFLGLLVMENRLKVETTPVILELNRANLRTVMVTGDNILTGVSVAKECGIVPEGKQVILITAHEKLVDGVRTESTLEYHRDVKTFSSSASQSVALDMSLTESSANYCFALTGQAWKAIYAEHPDLLQRVAVRGLVFARMSPEQKAQLVEVLQSVGYYVAMCGDGANDCGALKAAHSGISLSEAEASVASPFTSKVANITCVPQLIREGRAALVTSFGVFKFMAGYSLTQFTSVLLLYYVGVNLTDFEFLYIDLIVITSLSVTFPFTPVADTIHHHQPPVKLASFFPILILVLNTIIMAAVQIGAMFLTMRQPWFVAISETQVDAEDYRSYENTAVFDVSCFQYIILAVMFAQGAPYRKNPIYNIPFSVNVLITLALAIWLIMYPTDPVADILELELHPDYIGFRGYYILFGVGNFIVCMLLEKLVTGNDNVRLKFEKYTKVSCSKWNPGSKYEAVEEELNSATDWPPVSYDGETFAAALHREMSVTSSS